MPTKNRSCNLHTSTSTSSPYKGFTLPKTNSSPLKIGHPKRKGSSCNHPFPGATGMLVSGRVATHMSSRTRSRKAYGGMGKATEELTPVGWWFGCIPLVGGVKLMKILKATGFPGCFCSTTKNGCQVIQAVTQLDSLVGGHDEVTFKGPLRSQRIARWWCLFSFWSGANDPPLGKLLKIPPVLTDQNCFEKGGQK